jgi:ubiquinone/menaquinone biosynthesis C-methylase UbiE
MVSKVDLYDSHYAHTAADIYRQIRLETYGEDLGQTSWITAQEARQYFSWVGAQPDSSMLEVACGTGGLSLLAASELGLNVTGIDINEQAVLSARQAAQRAVTVAAQRAGGIAPPARVSFEVQDASRPLPYEGGSFDFIFCNDSINHLPDREAVLQEWWRLLKQPGIVLYTDPIVMTGPLSNQEIATRSAIGYFLFVPRGDNERLLRETGFEVLRVMDVTKSTADISWRWRVARSKREGVLVQLEGRERYEGLQSFLEVVHRLAAERRLSRFAYLAAKRSY